MSKWAVPAAAATALAAAVATAAPAHAAPKITNADFRMTVKGQQSRAWTLDRTVPDGCTGGSTRTTGNGTSKFTFATAEPVRVRFTRIVDKAQDSETVGVFVVDPPGVDTPVEGTVTMDGRHVHQQIGGGEPGCGGGGGSTPIPPDCGTKPFEGDLLTSYTTPDRFTSDPAPRVPILQFDGPTDDAGELPVSRAFKNCPGTEDGELLHTLTGGLPLKAVFGTKKRLTVRAREEQTSDLNGLHDEASMRWTAKLKRLRSAALPGAPECDDDRDNDRDGDKDFPDDRDCERRTDRSERR